MTVVRQPLLFIFHTLVKHIDTVNDNVSGIHQLKILGMLEVAL